MSGVVARYEEWYRKNSAWFAPFEEAVKMSTVFLPGRYSGADVSSEGVYALLSLVSAYHDGLVGRDRALPSDLVCARDTPATRRVRAALAVLDATEVMLEMAARRRWPEEAARASLPGGVRVHGRWAAVAAVEACKAALRLWVLRHNGGRVLIRPSLERLAAMRLEREARRLADKRRAAGPDADPLQDVRDMYALHGRGEGHPHGRFSAATNPAKRAPPPLDVLRESARPARAEVAAEALHVLRPVVFATLQALSRRPGAWRPWLASLAVDLASRGLMRPHADMSAEQRAEASRRVFAWAAYLVRSPAFELTLRRPLVAVLSLLARLPLVGFLFQSLLELCLSLQSYHFYTSAS